MFYIRKCTFIILVILFLLNIFLIYKMVRMERSYEYVIKSMEEDTSSLDMLMGMLPEVSEGKNKAEIIQSAMKYAFFRRQSLPLRLTEVNGCVNIGTIGFVFSEDDNLSLVTDKTCYGLEK